MNAVIPIISTEIISNVAAEREVKIIYSNVWRIQFTGSLVWH